MADYDKLIAQALIFKLADGEGILVRDDTQELYAVFRMDTEDSAGIHIAHADDLDIDLSGAESGHRIILHETEEQAQQAREADRMKLN